MFCAMQYLRAAQPSGPSVEMWILSGVSLLIILMRRRAGARVSFISG